MKIAFACLLTLTSTFSTLAATLTVEVHDIKSTKGDIVVTVYNSSKTWLEDGKKNIVKQHVVNLKDKVIEGVLITQIELPEGEYALQIYQDWDQNKEMDSNWIGMPKEPVATSNNAKGSMGPPSYKDAKFTLSESGTTQIVNIVDI
ncbi:DUF2141 domain-containing protein [Thalassotalea psychrophila]|uniref:DUF2141 domain-containing protein n=1 Tax=Thalassotalea psychrophila TaxID=3065647 RepID=A0ABY9TTY1_9GAMM|nr:DUF2141 domain-containing protein [Colwelliaceae bacterium SQ149]